MTALAALVCLAVGVALIARHRARRMRLRCLNYGRVDCPGCAWTVDRLGDGRR